MILMLIACLVVLTWVVIFEIRRRTAVAPASLGEMSERWLSQHRGSHRQ